MQQRDLLTSIWYSIVWKQLLYNPCRFRTWCSFAVLVYWFFSCCGLFLLLVHLCNRGRESCQSILAVLLPMNGRFFFSMLFLLGLFFEQTYLQGMKSQVSQLHCVKAFRIGLFCTLRIIPSLYASQKRFWFPKYRFCFF